MCTGHALGVRRHRGSRVAALSLILVAACGNNAAPRPGVARSEGGGLPTVVRIHLTTDPASLSLLGKTDRMTEILAVQITDGLVQYDPGLVIQPRLAESWELSEDRRSVTFHLRHGLRWHDGKPVTAGDVVFSVNKVRDPRLENRTWAPLFEDLASIDAPDDHTVRARYTAAKPDLLDGWRLPILPRHLAEQDADLLTGNYSKHPVGCGPYRFVHYRRGEELVLEANDDYWDGRPSIDRLLFRIFPDQRTAYQALLTDDLDVMVASPELWTEAQSSAAAGRLAATVYYALSVWHIIWNVDGSNPFFNDPRVRKAMVLALDRDAFIDKVHGGMARAAVTSYSPGLPWTDNSLEPLPYDPEQAKKLLDEAGWKDRDGDGLRERDGQPFRFSLMIAAGTQQVSEHMAAWQQQSWAEIGVRTEIEKLEFQQFRDRRIAHRFEAAEGSFHFTPNPDQYELYHSSSRTNGINYGGFSDPEVDRLLELGRTTFEQDSRKEIYGQLQRRLHELQPLAFLVQFGSPVLYDRRLQGIEPSGLDIYRTTKGPRVWRWVEAGPRD